MRTCSICKEDLPENSIHFASRKRKTKISFQGVCRECQKKYRKKHYEENKAKYIGKAAKYTSDICEWLDEYKKDLKCENCGEDRYWVLDFHHKDPNIKDDEISNLKRKGNKGKLIKEIEKCSVLCANCHRDFHFQEKQAGNA